jgi:hypothetical protein
MGVEFEYFYSLHQKIKSFYNFTLSSKNKILMVSIKKQTNNQNLVQTKKWTTKNQMSSFHAIKSFFF